MRPNFLLRGWNPRNSVSVKSRQAQGTPDRLASRALRRISGNDEEATAPCFANRFPRASYPNPTAPATPSSCATHTHSVAGGEAGGAGAVLGAWTVTYKVGVTALVVQPFGAAWGGVGLEGRRSRACRCSRGRRPSGSDSEATGRRVELPRRHPGAVGGLLTRTRLPRACRLQMP
jgi:hypothetical protein